MAENKEQRTIEIIVNGQKANASLKEMDAAAAVLYNQFRKMSADDPGRAKLIADYQALKGKVMEVKAELTGVSQSAGVMKQAFANAFALFTGGGIIGVVQQVWGFLKDSREEALASAKTTADLEATLKSTANAAGLTAQEIRNIGEARAKLTLFDDDQTNSASAMLLTFTNIKKGVFEDAIPAIQDLATKMAGSGGDAGVSLKGASVQVGKALNDPINGVTALTRVGVTFTEQQKEQIKAMVKAGDTAGAQRLILRELNKEFGGSAEAARKASGGVATLSMWFGEFKETVGGKVNQVLDALSQWFGRVLDKADPLVQMVTELVDQFAAYYREIGDVLEGLGLFNEKTDTAAIVIEVLKTALTLLLIPIRVLLQVSRAVVDTFIDWYNKSELLRGVIGGLGAVVAATFRAIKDDAIKYLGGVGDILVGIFTLDKDRILKGFRSTLDATVDLALAQGARASKAFQDGYEANKGNHIKRTKVVETKETTMTESGVSTSPGEEAAGKSAKEKAADAAKLKQRLAALLKQHEAEIEAERHHQEMLLNLREAALLAQGNQRQVELGRIELDAQRKIVAAVAAEKKEELLVTGTEQQKKAKIIALRQEQEAAVALIMAEARQKQQELQAKYAQEDAEQVEDDVAEQIADLEAAEAEKEALVQDKFEAGLLSEKHYHQQVYEAKRAALEAELALLAMFGGQESAEYRKKFKELEKLNKDYHKTSLADDKKAADEKKRIDSLTLKAAGDVAQGALDLLFQDEEARKKHHGMYLALSGAKIVAEGIAEVQAIWATFSEMGPVGVALAAVQTGISVARSAMAINKLNATGAVAGYAKGGATGSGAGMAISPMGTLLEMSGLAVGRNGQLVDNSGFAVAGIVHEDEYVVPKWMRADPQVAAVEQWLEARRLRGYFEGGATGGGASLPAASAAPQSDGELTYAVLVQLLEQSKQQTAQLADVKEWQSRLSVQLHTGEVEDVLAERKQVQLENGIRA